MNQRGKVNNMEMRIDRLRNSTETLCDRADALLKQLEKQLPAEHAGLLPLISDLDEAINQARSDLW
jgi:hypothetical protein